MTSPPPQPSLRPTDPLTLIVAALASGGAGWFLIGRFYNSLPRLDWAPTLTIGALAVLLGGAALDTRGRINQRPGARPVEPLLVARFAALAKASSIVGVTIGGLYAGGLVWLWFQRSQLVAARSDIPPAVGGALASILLVAAALWLEYSCRIPHSSDDQDTGEKNNE